MLMMINRGPLLEAGSLPNSRKPFCLYVKRLNVVVHLDLKLSKTLGKQWKRLGILIQGFPFDEQQGNRWEATDLTPLLLVLSMFMSHSYHFTPQFCYNGGLGCGGRGIWEGEVVHRKKQESHRGGVTGKGEVEGLGQLSFILHLTSSKFYHTKHHDPNFEYCI